MAFKQDFFTVAMVSDKGFAGNGSEIAIALERDTTPCIPSTTRPSCSSRRTAAAAVDLAMRLYLGPNHFGTLRRTESRPIRQHHRPRLGHLRMDEPLAGDPDLQLPGRLGLSYGIIILVLTLVIKMLLMPLTYKNLVSSAKMRVLKPEMDAITRQVQGRRRAEEAAGHHGPVPQGRGESRRAAVCPW